jgi:hypothetical protein
MKSSNLLIVFGLILIGGPLAAAYGALLLHPSMPMDGGFFPIMIVLWMLTAPVGLVLVVLGIVTGLRRAGKV